MSDERHQTEYGRWVRSWNRSGSSLLRWLSPEAVLCALRVLQALPRAPDSGALDALDAETRLRRLRF